MTSNWFISEPVSLYHPFNQVSEVLPDISTLDHSYIFYYNIEYEKTEKRKRVERGRLFLFSLNYFSGKEGFLIVRVEYNLKVSSIYSFLFSYSFPNIKVSCISV